MSIELIMEKRPVLNQWNAVTHLLSSWSDDDSVSLLQAPAPDAGSPGAGACDARPSLGIPRTGPVRRRRTPCGLHPRSLQASPIVSVPIHWYRFACILFQSLSGRTRIGMETGR